MTTPAKPITRKVTRGNLTAILTRTELADGTIEFSLSERNAQTTTRRAVIPQSKAAALLQKTDVTFHKAAREILDSTQKRESKRALAQHDC